MKGLKKSIWIVSREYAGIAEAGGVKNVTTSLAETLVKKDYDVTVFIPQYGCYEQKGLQNYTSLEDFYIDIPIAGEIFTISYASAQSSNVTILFIKNHIFSSKNAVYTYTKNDEMQNSIHRRGLGHIDSHIMNALFQKAVLEYGILSHKIPDIIHCQDASTALLPVYVGEDIRMKDVFKNTKSIVTIHNAGPGYHHSFNSIDDAYKVTNLPHHVLMYGLNNTVVEPFLLASKYARLTTVSPWYAKEITDPLNEFTDGLSKMFSEHKTVIDGILNGIDYDRYDPQDTKKSLLCATFNPLKGDFFGKEEVRNCFLKKIEKHVDLSQTDGVMSIVHGSKIEQFGSLQSISKTPVIFGYHGRIVWQKGLEILVHAARIVLHECKHACFVVIGQGQPEIEQLHIDTAREFEGRYLYLRGYERTLARECIASSDFLVLPSVFEPCGLEDFIGQIFATLPIAHKVGGLQKIQDEVTGFLYTEQSVHTLAEKIKTVYELYISNPERIQKMRIKAACTVHNEYTWNNIVQNFYIPLYEK